MFLNTRENYVTILYRERNKIKRNRMSFFEITESTFCSNLARQQLRSIHILIRRTFNDYVLCTEIIIT